MDLLNRVWKTFARFVGLIMVIMGGWLIAVNVNDLFSDAPGFSGLVLAWILGSGVAAAVGGVLFLLSLDKPHRFRTRRTRPRAIVLMIAGSALPSSLTPVVLPLSLLMLTTLKGLPQEEPATSD